MEALKDKDIREPLFDFLEETFGKVRIIEEKQMGRSRADIVMVLEGALAGIEIKSDADTYARLARQVVDYDRFFDYNFLVVGSSHALHAHEHVPENWGIISAEMTEDAGIDFYILREAQRNVSADIRLQLRFLWRPELAKIQEMYGMPAYAQKSKQFVIGKIAQTVPAPILRPRITEALFERDYEEELKEIRKFRRTHSKPSPHTSHVLRRGKRRRRRL